MSAEDRRARAEARRGRLSLRKASLGDAEHDFSPVRAEEAISLASALTAESWTVAGREIPRYVRADTPYRFVRGWPP